MNNKAASYVACWELASWWKEALVHINGGDYLVGAYETDSEAYPQELPQRQIVLDDFLIMKRLVTISDFSLFVKETSYKASKGAIFFDGNDWEMDEDLSWESPGYSFSIDYPVTCVTFWDIQEFIKWASVKTGLNLRLPSEAEWEIAARAGTKRSRFWGNTMRGAKKYANVAGRQSFFKAASPVMFLAPNPWGIFDMLGNVFEWTGSDYRDPYDGAEVSCSQSEQNKSYRGGSFNSSADTVRCSARAPMPPELASNQIGFRLAVESGSTLPLEVSQANISKLTEEINSLSFGETKSFKIKVEI